MDALKDELIYQCLRLSRQEADQWSRSSRKVLRGRKITFRCWDDSLQLEDLGFTPKKLKDLQRNYLQPQSRAVAVELWDRQRQNAKYGSVAFTTFNHFVKGGDSVEEVEKTRSRIASVQGPCIQSVVITWLAKDEVAVDVFYRSTELFKKFGADVIFIRDVLLTPFDFSGMEIVVTCHFANMTLHPGYWVTILAHVEDPVACMEEVRRKDPSFHRQLVKHTAEYLCPECGSSIANHAQSQRVKEHALKTIRGSRLRSLQEYLREHD
jgi:hypothetical protein